MRRPRNLNVRNRLGLNRRLSFVSEAGFNGLNLRGDEQNLKNNLKSIIFFRFEIPLVTKMAPPDIFCRGSFYRESGIREIVLVESGQFLLVNIESRVWNPEGHQRLVIVTKLSESST